MQLLDVHLEFDPMRLAAERDPVQTIAALSHLQAIEEADAAHCQLRHGHPIEVTSTQAINPLTGRDVMLVATRWVVD